MYSVLLLANSLQSGLITQPHNVLGGDPHGGDYACYTTSTAVGQLFLLGPSLRLACWPAWAVAGVARLGVAPLAADLVLDRSPGNFEEFVRRVLDLEGRLAVAFSTTGQLRGPGAGVAALWWLVRRTRALAWVPSLDVRVAAVSGLADPRQPRGPVDPGGLRENWHFGKWLVAENIVGTGSPPSSSSSSPP